MSGLTILHGCRTLQLTRGHNTLIDEADFADVGRFKWQVSGSLLTNYARRTDREGSGRVLRILHRVIIDPPPKLHVDHRNGDGLDNRRANLRICTHSQNLCNRRRARGRSRFKGVSERRDAKGISTFRAYICVGSSKIKTVGTFATETEAARAYDRAAIERYGEFARTNADIHGDY